MIPLKFSKCYYQTPFLPRSSEHQKGLAKPASLYPSKVINSRKLVVSGCSGQESEKKTTERRSFLSLEEAGLVEISGLSTHERFLCRLTISSLNLLRVISEQEGCPIEELNAGRVCDWFLEDKLKREQNIDSAVLQWDDSDYQL
uniref:Receptor-interacting protein n=1 Tax=Rhizophora mucronata TaxID=61149 RepID=A0A2P2J5D5_RHIMU